MCQILFAQSKNPPTDVIEYAAERNSHGFGYSWSEANGVSWVKGLDSKDHVELLTHIEEFLAKPFPKAIHFRLATHGGVRKELTHPFPIKRGNSLALDGSAKMVLFHNGVWNKWDDCLREAIFGGTLNPNVLREPMSDSRAMAILCQRFGPDIIDVLPTGSNKILILMANTYYRYGDWKDMDGWSASNHSIDKPKTVIYDKFSKRERKGQYGIHVVSEDLPTLTGASGTSYLSADREAVEQSILEWGERGSSNYE